MHAPRCDAALTLNLMVPDPHAPIDGSPAAHRAQSQDDICVKHVAQATPLARPPARQCCPCACGPPTEKAQMWYLLSSATGRDACHARPASPAPNLMKTAHSCTNLGSVQRVGRQLRRSQNDMCKCCRRPGAHTPRSPAPHEVPALQGVHPAAQSLPCTPQSCAASGPLQWACAMHQPGHVCTGPQGVHRRARGPAEPGVQGPSRTRPGCDGAAPQQHRWQPHAHAHGILQRVCAPYGGAASAARAGRARRGSPADVAPRLARVGGLRAQLLFDAQQLVVLGQALRPGAPANPLHQDTSTTWPGAPSWRPSRPLRQDTSTKASRRWRAQLCTESSPRRLSVLRKVAWCSPPGSHAAPPASAPIARLQPPGRTPHSASARRGPTSAAAASRGGARLDPAGDWTL